MICGKLPVIFGNKEYKPTVFISCTMYLSQFSIPFRKKKNTYRAHFLVGRTFPNLFSDVLSECDVSALSANS
jgi:hypothetical protein